MFGTSVCSNRGNTGVGTIKPGSKGGVLPYLSGVIHFNEGKLTILILSLCHNLREEAIFLADRLWTD